MTSADWSTPTQTDSEPLDPTTPAVWATDHYDDPMPRDTFEGSDEPVNPAAEHDEVLKVVLESDPTQVTDVTDEDAQD